MPGARARRGSAALAAALAVVLLAPAASEASFHLMKIREVSAGAGAGTTGDFVELQMLTGGQNELNTHEVTIRDAAGAVTATIPLTMVPQGGTQRTVLIAAADVNGVTPDITDAQVEIPLTDGAVCFDEAQPPDCVTWGAFADPTPIDFPNLQAANAPAMTSGMSLTRSIAPGCSTLLESGDDTDNSSTDFALTTPTPRNNSTAPTETACAAPPSNPPGGTDPEPDPEPEPQPEPIVVLDVTAPETTIDKAPRNELKKPKATIEFSSSEAGSRFECALGKDDFEACASPHKLSGLERGKNKFQVRAIDAAGNTDATPAKATIKVAKKKRRG